MLIRVATEADLPAISDIYNDEVMHGTATFDTEPRTLDEQRDWLAHHDPSTHPVTVCEDANVVLGWASLSRWSPRHAYDRLAEVSVYVHRDQRGRGVGKALLEDLVERARRAGIAALLARITTESDASLRLHEKLGFRRFGTMRRAGEKHGRILDVALLDRHLDME